MMRVLMPRTSSRTAHAKVVIWRRIMWLQAVEEMRGHLRDDALLLLHPERHAPLRVSLPVVLSFCDCWACFT